MITRQVRSVLLAAGVALSSVTYVRAGDDRSQAQEDQSAPPKGATDPAAPFAMLVESVMSSKDALEVELPQSADMVQFLTKPVNGRYVVKRLTFTKGNEVRGLSVALHAIDDVFLMRGKEVASAFEGIYYAS